ncbi:centromere protein J isoform X2 [Scyliorhinus canicula]|uniref:centromere protein J isoform X2 n=1 Tax=Scyliorhinus canicula TaxID=7830 RepID=UPI0018F687E9|nr:centromere protein J isoform X2 [Scyliorhinus canicula]
MENSKMSTVINNQGQHFLAEWTTNVTRAGVILNAPFCFNDTNTPAQEGISADDSFIAQFAPLQFSNSSSCTSIDSLHDEPLLNVNIPNGREQTAFDINTSLTSDLHSTMTQHTFSSQNGLVYCNNGAVKQAEEKITCNTALIQRLEQLREWQQGKQEQLKKQHLEQLQRLEHEQQALLGLIGAQQGFTDSLSNLKNMEKKQPIKADQQIEKHIEQDNVVLEDESEGKNEPNSGCSFSREPSSRHPNNKDSTSASFFQSPSEEHDSNHRPSFTATEERPIKPGVDVRKESFEEYLDKQMQREEERLKNQQLKLMQSQLPAVLSEGKGNQKRKFLKRGEGLARFSKVKSSILATNKADKEMNLTDQQVTGSQSSMNATHQKLQRKLTLLNKENHFGDLTGVSNNPKLGGKGKYNSALCVKKVTVLDNGNGDRAYLSPPKMQTERIKNTPVGKVQNVHKIAINCKTESANIVQECKQSAPKHTGESSVALDRLMPVHNGEKFETNENIVPTWPSNKDATKPECTLEISFRKHLEKWSKEKEKENVELNEFEFLEQAAEELSFSSNSSFVLKMVQHDLQINKGRRLSSTPIKSDQQVAQNSSVPMNHGNTDFEGKENVDLNSRDILEHRITIEENFKNAFASPVRDKVAFKNVECDPLEDEYTSYDSTSDSEIDDLDSTLTNEKTMKKQPVICSSDKEDNPKSKCRKQPTDGLSKDRNIDTDLDLSSSSLSDVDIEMPTVIENKKFSLSQKPDSSLFNSRYKNSSPLHQEKVEFDDDQTWADLEEDGPINTADNSTEPVYTSVLDAEDSSSRKAIEDKVMRRKVASAKKGEAVDVNIMNKSTDSPPISDLIARLFPSLKPKAELGSDQGLEQKFKAVNDKPLGAGIQSKLLRDKLVELESEIDQFRAENATLAKLRNDREKTLMDLRKEMTDFEHKKTEELAQFEEYKKEELKRLQKERMVFEKHAAAARAIPDKKEREEIQVLKQQIVDLKEELKRKELRWSSIHSRLRNQIDILTKENQELRDEVNIIERLRLETWKKAEAAIEKKIETTTPWLKKTELVIPSDIGKMEIDSLIRQTDRSRIAQEGAKKSSQRAEQTSPRDVKLSHTVTCSAPAMTRNGLKESSVSISSSMSLSKKTDSATGSMMHSEPFEKLPNSDRVSVPASSNLESNGTEDEIQEVIKYPDGKVEQVLRSGRHIIIFCNGTRKEISADGKTVKVTFFNGDVKQIMSDQTVVYYYADAQTTHTTYTDGLEILQFPSNQIEKHYPDGRKEITFPDQTIKYLFTDGHEESVFPDGTIIRMQLDGNKIIEFINGQREIHTSNYKRREYPDGTVKTVFANGQQETKYSSGRVRIKDKEGNVIMDSKPQ